MNCWHRLTTANAGDAIGSTWFATPTPAGSSTIGIVPTAWRYRDYVIRAFNEDKPYDRFVQRADSPATRLWPDSADARIATGYLRLGTGEQSQERADAAGRAGRLGEHDIATPFSA